MSGHMNDHWKTSHWFGGTADVDDRDKNTNIWVKVKAKVTDVH